MSSYCVIDESGQLVGKIVSSLPKEIVLQKGQRLSFVNQLTTYSKGPKFTFSTRRFGGAKGTATFFDSKTRSHEPYDGIYTIKVYGRSIRAVDIVATRLEEQLGSKSLNPKLSLPDLPTFWGRVKYFLDWLLKGKLD